MDSNLSLIKALATTLLAELDSLNFDDNDLTLEGDGVKYFELVREFETKLIRTALTKTGGNQTRAARLLGMNLSTLNHKIQTFEVQYLKFETERRETSM